MGRKKYTYFGQTPRGKVPPKAKKRLKKFDPQARFQVLINMPERGAANRFEHLMEFTMKEGGIGRARNYAKLVSKATHRETAIRIFSYGEVFTEKVRHGKKREHPVPVNTGVPEEWRKHQTAYLPLHERKEQ